MLVIAFDCGEHVQLVVLLFYDIMILGLWSFAQYKSASGRRVITDWRKNLTPARRASLDLFLNRIGKMETWTPDICKKLKGYSEFWELRWVAEKVEHRIFGYFDGSRRFVMLAGCTHKGRVYDPPGVFDTINDRKRKLSQSEGVIANYGPDMAE